MTRDIRVSARAATDADAIFDWHSAYSAEGAIRWYQSFLAALQVLRDTADMRAVAPEAEALSVDLCQAFFKVRKGRIYRTLFVIDGETVHIVGVRGAGQDLASAVDIELP